jgi:hypothetical protein
MIQRSYRLRDNRFPFIMRFGGGETRGDGASMFMNRLLSKNCSWNKKGLRQQNRNAASRE